MSRYKERIEKCGQLYTEYMAGYQKLRDERRELIAKGESVRAFEFSEVIVFGSA